LAVLVLAALAFGLGPGSAEAKKRRGKRRGPARPAVPALTPLGLPNVQSASALVVDLDRGTILYGKNPDRPRYIASTGKIFVALAVRRRGIDLEGITEITMDDAQAARGGARTRLDVRESYRNIDLLRAMLIASDNRAVTAVGRAVGLSPEGLVAEMNAVARALGLTRTSFTDPVGLTGNLSTAREMAVALKATLADPVLAEILATKFTSIHRVSHARPRGIHYANTNQILHRDRYSSLGGKTGYTDRARYCLINASQLGGRRVAFVLLGASGELTRYGDFGRLWAWVEDQGGFDRDVGDSPAGSSAARAQKTEDAR
jgi:D-alanyl-D-alanine endopeptidase (penicillin-binding protein 7)